MLNFINPTIIEGGGQEADVPNFRQPHFLREETDKPSSLSSEIRLLLRKMMYLVNWQEANIPNFVTPVFTGRYQREESS